MVELLINAGADVNAECKGPFSDLVYNCSLMKYKDITVDELFYRLYCNQPVCDGNRVIDFSFAYGLWKVMNPFISKGKLHASSLNDVRWNPLKVAAIYDRVDFMKAIDNSIIKTVTNIETVLRYMAVCHSVRVPEHFLYSQDVSKLTTAYEDGKTLLHFAI